MTSARTCYCKQERCVFRGEDNDIVARSENRRPTTVASRKSIVKSGSSGGSLGTARSVVDEKKSDTSRSTETRTRDPVLSPETSTALENAERIINDAKIQLAKVCVVSGFDSARRDRDTYTDDPPLDDEVEELLYIRELVTSKFQEASYPGRPEAGGEENAPRVTARRVDLSAPKFQTSQRRRAATSLECETDEQRSRGRAPLAGAPKDSKDPLSKDDEATTRDSQTARNRRRVSSAARFGSVHPDNGDVCKIQIGPPVHVNGELTRQDLEDVHISPESSPIRRRVNAATYILRHENVVAENSVSVDNEVNEPVMTSRTRRRARLVTPSKEKREKLIATKAVIETTMTSTSRNLEEDIRLVVENKDSDYERENEQNEPTTSQVQDNAYGEVRSDEEADLRDAENAKIFERPMASAMNEETTDAVGKSEEPVRINQAAMDSGNNIESRHVGDGEVFNKKSGVDSLGRPQNEDHVADKIQAKNRSDQSQPSLVPVDISRRVSFPQRENIARPCRTTASLKQYWTIDEYLSNTLNSHDGPNEPCDVVTEEMGRSRLSWDDFSAKDDASEVELYRPRLDDLDSILLSNDKKIERAVRATQIFTELLSKPEFVKYKFEEREQETNRDNPPIAGLSGDHGRRNLLILDNSTTSSSVVAITPKNQAPSVSSVSEMRRASDADSQETSAAAMETKSSSFTRRNVYRHDDRSQNSVESIERPTSDVSNDSRMSPDEDNAQQPKSKARLSESSMDKSDITTFSNLPPALSSTRTDTQTYRSQQEQSKIAQAKSEASENRYADLKLRVTNYFEDSANKADRQMKQEYNIDDVFAQILQGLRDETTDQFVAYILQDERRNIERKIAKALNESAITPTMIEKFLARLQKTDSVGDGATRRTETLDVLKDILIKVKSQTDGVVNDEVAKEEKESEKIDSRNISPRAIEELTPHEENGQSTRTRVAFNENRQLIEDSHDLGTRDERSEIRGSITHTIPGSRGSSESKKDSYSEGESLKKISDILSDKAENPKEDSRHLPAKTASMRSQKDHEAKGDGPDAATKIFQDEKGNMSDEVREEHKLVEVKDEKDSACGDQHTNENIPGTTIDRVNDALLSAPDGIFVVVKKKEEETEITAEKITNDNTVSKDQKVSPPVSDTSKKKDKQAQLDANSGKSRVVEEISTKKGLARSLTENTRSSNAQAEKVINNLRADPTANGKISPANSCSADSLQDCASLRTSSSMQNDELPLKETQSCAKRTFLDIVGEGNSTKTGNKGGDGHGEPVTSAALENRENGNEELAFLESMKSGDNEQLRPITSTLLKSLSSSSSSVSNITLDHYSGFNNGVFGDDAKRTETSSEMSHSEGELYMPSSCSYSLGEVRILEKGDLIADSTIERDSSVTILVTRSMLTSLNDSSTALGSSGCV